MCLQESFSWPFLLHRSTVVCCQPNDDVGSQIHGPLALTPAHCPSKNFQIKLLRGFSITHGTPITVHSSQSFVTICTSSFALVTLFLSRPVNVGSPVTCFLQRNGLGPLPSLRLADEKVPHGSANQMPIQFGSFSNLLICSWHFGSSRF